MLRGSGTLKVGLEVSEAQNCGGLDVADTVREGLADESLT